MNTITPLMRAMMEALDKAECNMTEPELSVTVAYMGYREGADTEQRALRTLVAEQLLRSCPPPLDHDWPTMYTLTDAGCDALWALQKADAVSRTVVRDHDAYNPARDGDLLAWKPGEPRVAGGVRPVYFNSRDEFIAYTSGAKA